MQCRKPFAPGSDHLAYLAGAKNVRRLSMETRPIPRPDVQGESASSADPMVYRFTRYAFDLDGLAFAQHMRDQLENYLRERGELPLGLTLDSSRTYQNTTGEGELWVDTRGLPLRLTMHLAYPEDDDGERVEADITTDFSAFPERYATTSGGSWLPTAVRSLTAGLPRTESEVREAFTRLRVKREQAFNMPRKLIGTVMPLHLHDREAATPATGTAKQ